MSQSESVIVCEGYFDRAFWHGLLMHHLKCTDQRKEGPWGKVAGGGVYGFTSPTGRALRIVPTNTRPRKGNARNPVFQGGELSSPFFGVKVAPSPRRLCRPRSLVASLSKASRQQVSLRSKAPQIPFL